MKISKIFIASFLGLAMLSSCKKETEVTPPATETGELEIHFDARVGADDLVFGTTYTNGSGENFKVSQLKYFVTNIKLKKADGTEYVVPANESYFLVNDAIDSTQHISLKNIPAGDYNQVTFMLGVDSLTNTKPVDQRTGALDIAGAATGMYWTWNSGYIHFKMEGTYGSAFDSTFMYHIGLYGGYSTPTINNTRWINMSSTSSAQVRKDNTPEVHVYVSLEKFFNSTNTISISASPTIMGSATSYVAADNYATMFQIHHIHN